MPFIDEILKYRSISIVGLEKNTGKTECLNYILNRIKNKKANIAITSIGIDGENIDQVSLTHKPEIDVFEGMYFITSEKHFKEKRLIAEICNISDKRTSLGRLVTAKAISTGKVIFSGPPDTKWLKDIINSMSALNINTTIVDGALSRKSIGSPAITDAMILNTGAALSLNINQLLKKTKYIVDLINIDSINTLLTKKLSNIETGVWAIDDDNIIQNLNISSVFAIENNKNKLFSYGYKIFVAGAVSDSFINFLRTQNNCNKIELIVKDFSKIFATPEMYNSFLQKGGKIKVLYKTKLLAVCVNPISPDGFSFNSKEITEKLSEKLNLPVYDIKKI